MTGKILIDRAVVEQALEAMMATHYKMIDAGILDQDLLNKNFTAHEAIKDALAEQPAEQPAEQEPVAWVERDGELVWNNRQAAIGRNLYTAPQPAKREPLTWDELDVLWEKQRSKPFKSHGDDLMEFARAIERAHGIGGQS